MTLIDAVLAGHVEVCREWLKIYKGLPLVVGCILTLKKVYLRTEWMRASRQNVPVACSNVPLQGVLCVFVLAPQGNACVVSACVREERKNGSAPNVSPLIPDANTIYPSQQTVNIMWTKTLAVVSQAALLAAAGAGAGKPNFVFLLTDDQDMKLGSEDVYTKWGSIEAQPKLQERVLHQGAAMTNFFVATPICCPSRTEFFTGRYFHNIRGVNGTGCMHVDTGNVSDPEHGLFGKFHSNGYSTGIFGKVTNDQTSMLPALAEKKSVSYISSPWAISEYMGLQWFNYNATAGDVNGTMETINKTNPIYGTPYQTSQIGNRSLAWLDDVVARDALPFFMYLGPHAPHCPSQPAPWYENEFSDLKAPRTPNFGVESPNKTTHIRQNGPMSEDLECWIDEHHRDRWRSLLSVDDLVEGVYERLDKYGLTDNTYFFYTSDHGFKLGQWRVATAKLHPYETDIRIPLFAHGPGIAAGVELPDIAGNVDLFPTLLKLAGIDQPVVDGREFASALLGQDSAPPRTAWLTEYESIHTALADSNSVWTPASWQHKCGGQVPTGPAGNFDKKECVELDTVGDGKCYMIDSTTSNNWRALRRINATHDTQYIEYVKTWDFCPGCETYYEYYNVAEDLYQVKNLYYTLPQETRDSLAAEMKEYYACKGASCP